MAAADAAKPYIDDLKRCEKEMRKRWKNAPESAFNGAKDLEDITPDDTLLKSDVWVTQRGVYLGKRIQKCLNEPLVSATRLFTQGITDEEGVTIDIEGLESNEFIGKIFFDKIAHGLIEDSLGAIRVDEWTTEQDVRWAYQAIQQFRNSCRDKMGDSHTQFRTRTELEKMSDRCPRWYGLDSKSKRAEILTALYYVEILGFGYEATADELWPSGETGDRDTVKRLLKRGRQDLEKL